MALRSFARRALIGAGVVAAGSVAAYRKDLTQLPFDAASAVGPVVRLLDAETSHNFGIWCAKHGVVPRERRPDPPSLRVRVWDKDFPNPLGLAAGFDKQAEAIDGLLGLGFGFIEVGSVTPLPQPGNAKPRSFRLPELGAVINRYGFNSDGIDRVGENLAAYRQRAAAQPGRNAGLLGINLGKNKVTEDPAGDFSIGVTKLAKYADFLVVNVSSPNTPGLRALQGPKPLAGIVKRVKVARDGMEWGPKGPPPLLLKIAPDLTEADKRDIAAVAMKQGVDGLIVSNTTVARPPAVLQHPNGHEEGGLSGAPLLEPSTAVLRDMYALTQGKLPLIGCGGVSTGEHAYRKIRAGAALVEVYTALAYEGPSVIPRIKRELAEILQREGFASVQDAIGADHPQPQEQKKRLFFF